MQGGGGGEEVSSGRGEPGHNSKPVSGAAQSYLLRPGRTFVSKSLLDQEERDQSHRGVGPDFRRRPEAL